MGSDERAAYTSGVPITTVRIGAHLISGCFAGLAAICFTALISSGDPSQGTTYTLIAVTALVLGGASLAGGRGGVFGSALGAVNLYLITFCLSTFNFGAVQSFVTNLAYGTILVASLLLTLLIPVIQRRIRNFSPLLYFVALSVIVLGVILHATFDYSALGTVSATLPGALDMQAALVGPLEITTLDPATEALRLQAAPLVFGAVVLAVVAVFLRLAIGQSSRNSIGPAVAVILASLVLAGAWLMTREAQTSQTGQPEATASEGDG
jgi:ribose transport system permease protein